MSRKIWSYVLAVDTGFAPCIDDGILSLACCKPLIRRNAKVGDYIFGFMPKKLTGFQQGRLSWMGVVSQIMPFADYMKVYSGRSDAIYVSSEISPDGSTDLVHMGGEIHADAKAQQRDIFGQKAIICEPFWYWGQKGIFMPERIASKLVHYRQGHKRIEGAVSIISEIDEWTSTYLPGIYDLPRNPLFPNSIKKYDGPLLKFP